MKNYIIIIFFLTQSISYCQWSKLDISLAHNSLYKGALYSYNHLEFQKLNNSVVNSLTVGVHFSSIGEQHNKILSLKHGLEFYFPYNKNQAVLSVPQNNYSFITNSLSFNFFKKRYLNASLNSDLRFLIEKQKFRKKEIEIDANRWIFGTGVSFQPFPQKNPFRLFYNLNITPSFKYKFDTHYKDFHFSNIGLEYKF